MDLYFVSVVAFLSILAILIYKDRKNIEFHHFLLIRRSKTGIRILEKIAKPKRFWKIFGTVGVAIAILLMYRGIESLITYGQLLVSGKVKVPGLSFVLPSVKQEVEIGYGYLLLPFWFWVVIIISVLVPHEMLHGIMSRAEDVRIKSTGLLLLLFIPGAFVEPDEKQLKKCKVLSKLRIFVSGSLGNFFVYLLVFFLVSNLVWPKLVPGPIILKEVDANGPASKAGLEANMVVTKINGKPIKSTYHEFLSGLGYLSEEVKGLKPDDEVLIEANNTEFRVKLGKNPKNESLPYLGITYSPLIAEDQFLWSLFWLLNWIWMINYAVGLFNLLPIFPLDGGMIVQAIAEKISKKHAKEITLSLTLITLSMLAFNFFAPFLLR